MGHYITIAEGMKHLLGPRYPCTAHFTPLVIEAIFDRLLQFLFDQVGPRGRLP